jgi:hypothetical protein
MKTKDRVVMGLVTIVTVWMGVIVAMGLISLMVTGLMIWDWIISKIGIVVASVVLISIVAFIKGFTEEPEYSYWDEIGRYWER